ncbi:MAG: hypothetical protein LBN41_02120 [Enterobacteriaceae bacterium]|jgi:hypothetical protein|nr:hypothetical protein [Enterobacteriaceae bacterium]
MRWRIILTLFVVGVLSGCAHKEYVEVSAIAAKDAPTQLNKFVVVSEKYQSVDGDLQFAEYARQVITVLNQQGYVQVQNRNDAQVLVALSYSIGTPQIQTEVLNTPVYPWGDPSYSIGFGYYPYHAMFGYSIYQPVAYQSVNYKKLIHLQAIDAAQYAKDQTVKTLWDVRIANNSDNSDLRYLFPYMLMAAEPYFGKDSEHSVVVPIEENDPAVVQLRSVR